MNICTCAMHCPQSPHHDYSCCRSQECACWCHKIVSRQQKTIVAHASNEQMEEAARAYDDHRRACDQTGIEPATFGAFVAEWLECESIEARLPRSAPASSPRGSSDDYLTRDYDRMFEGKRGWD